MIILNSESSISSLFISLDSVTTVIWKCYLVFAYFLCSYVRIYACDDSMSWLPSKQLSPEGVLGCLLCNVGFDFSWAQYVLCRVRKTYCLSGPCKSGDVIALQADVV